MRICSLLPGATEVVAALGLADNLVGVSHECDFPPEVRNKPVFVHATVKSEDLGSAEIDRQVKQKLASGEDLYTLDEALFEQVQPDLVITQELCDVCAVTPSGLQRALSALPHPPQLVSLNPTTLEDVVADVERIGNATGQEAKAKAYADTLRRSLSATEKRVAASKDRPRVLCLEWFDPLYVAGHWIPEMVRLAGGVDVLGTAGTPSRVVSWEDIMAAAPEVVILMPCGFSVERTRREFHELVSRVDWDALPAVRAGKVFAVDASSFFSRPGPRLVEGTKILASLCHPTLFGEPELQQAQRVDILPNRCV